ncbi:hypothetical protein ALNOE001_06450 [Candidatus Methanobinarius endosymbioticus]|uniref:Chromosome partition protein Smc n=1 Tax=Candidatus Methanobinarius endosymbioticus TaxID=2006182 RepID=A0A366ME41_9EURY|nr:hypothetical protein ALNOE001_06450 [Candidatus Methanobinarius endosymbioticus]
MKAELNKELEQTKKELGKTKSELKLLEDKLDYCQNRLIDIRNEKDNLINRINKYESIDIDTKLKEAEHLKNDFLKQNHRLKITKDLLDDSREEVSFLKDIVQDFKNISILDFMRKKYPENINTHFIKYEKYNKHKQFNDQLNKK